MDTPTITAPTAQDQRFTQHLRALTDEAQALLDATARVGDEKFDATRERLRDEMRHLRERLGDLEVNATERAKRMARQADEAVQHHPYGAMGIAAAVGLLVGVLVARR